MKSGYSAKDYRDIANAGQQANKVNVSAVEEKSKMLAPDSVPQTRIEKLKNDFSNAKEFSSNMAQGAKAKVVDMYQGAKDTAAEKTSDLFSRFRRNKTTSESLTVGEDIGDEADIFFGGHNQ